MVGNVADFSGYETVQKEFEKLCALEVRKLEEFLKNVNDKSKTVYFYHQEDNPFNDGIGTVNVFEVSKDEENTGNFEGVYIQGC